MELRVGNKYRLGRKIGSGSFGDIYLGKLIIILEKQNTNKLRNLQARTFLNCYLAYCKSRFNLLIRVRLL